jgi:tetratricopeptide (TPR) repeat protein
MPLSRYVQDQTDRINVFLADPEAVVLEVRTAAEQLPLVTKLLVGLSQQQDALFAGVEGEFGSSEAFCGAVEASLREAVQEAAAFFAEEGMAFSAPEGSRPPGSGAYTLTPEQRLVEYAERVALALDPVFKNLVVVVKPTVTPKDKRPFSETLARLGAACEGGRFKLVLLVEPESSVVVEAPGPRLRLTGYAGKSPHAAEKELREFVSDPLRRVLAMDGERRTSEWVEQALAGGGRNRRLWVVRVDEVPFWRPIHFFGRAAERTFERCLELAPQRGQVDEAALARELRGPEGGVEAELHFVQRLERLVETALPAESSLLVVLCPAMDAGGAPEADQRGFRASVELLARATGSTRLKFVAVAPELGGFPEDARARTIRVQDFRIDASTIESGLEEKLKQAELPLIERLRCTSALAGFCLSRGEAERGMELSLEVLELATKSEQPMEIALAWYGMGNALYRCGALDKAAEAYTRCVELSIDENQPALAAQGLTGVGNCYFVVGQAEQAIGSYEVARTYFSKLGHGLGEAYALMWIGETHAKAKSYPKAVRAFQEALECCERMEPQIADGAAQTRAEVLQRLARVYKLARMNEDYRRCVDEARKLGFTVAVSDEP